MYPEHSSNGAFGSLKEKYNLPDINKRLPCKKVFTDMVIYWNGDAAVCNHDWGRKEYIGMGKNIERYARDIKRGFWEMIQHVKDVTIG